MHFATALTTLGLMASAAVAAPYEKRQTAAGETVVYWGQNGGGVVENNDLSSYCTSTSGIDIIVLAFLYQYGQGVDNPTGVIGQSCSIQQGVGQNCDDVAKGIETCKGAGIKVILSLGGASGSYSLGSQQEAETIGQNLWDSYGNAGTGSSAPRPFGDTFVNGWDFDLEASAGNQYYQYVISTLRSNFAKDASNTYYITGAPQCPVPEPNMQQIITTSQFDYLWVQFYNNPGCSADTGINYDAWVSNVANTPSSNAKIFIGLPASTLGATGTESGAKYYLEPSAMADVVNQHKTSPAFGGVMMWNAGFSDSNVNNGCTYAQEVHSVLTKGSVC